MFLAVAQTTQPASMDAIKQYLPNAFQPLVTLTACIVTAICTLVIAKVNLRATRLKSYLEIYKLACECKLATAKSEIWAASVLELVQQDSIRLSSRLLLLVSLSSFGVLGYNLYIVSHHGYDIRVYISLVIMYLLGAIMIFMFFKERQKVKLLWIFAKNIKAKSEELDAMEKAAETKDTEIVKPE